MKGSSEAAGADGDRAAMRRQRVVDAARKLFVLNGFHATGVAQIATESGVAVGQIYRDFASKEAIIASIAEADCNDFLAHDALQRGIDAGDVQAVWAWLEEFIDPGLGESGILISEIMAESTRNENVAAIFERTRRDVGSTMLAALSVLAPGDAHEARRTVLADLVLAIALGILQQRLMDKASDTASVVETAMRLIRAEVATMRAGDSAQSA